VPETPIGVWEFGIYQENFHTLFLLSFQFQEFMFYAVAASTSASEVVVRLLMLTSVLYSHNPTLPPVLLIHTGATGRILRNPEAMKFTLAIIRTFNVLGFLGSSRIVVCL
jgi:hypothetical protein